MCRPSVPQQPPSRRMGCARCRRSMASAQGSGASPCSASAPSSSAKERGEVLACTPRKRAAPVERLVERRADRVRVDAVGHVKRGPPFAQEGVRLPDQVAQARAVDQAPIPAEREAEHIGQAGFGHGLGHALGLRRGGQDSRQEEVRARAPERLRLPPMKGARLLTGERAFARIGVAAAAHEPADAHRPALREAAQQGHVLYDQLRAMACALHACTVGAARGRRGEEGQAVRPGDVAVFPPEAKQRGAPSSIATGPRAIPSENVIFPSPPQKKWTHSDSSVRPARFQDS